MGKTHKAEDEAARRIEAVRIKEEEITRRERLFVEIDRKVKDLHYLHCPKCGHELQTVLAESLEVETCEPCKGVWLGKNELEVLMKYTIDRRKSFMTQIFGPG